MSGCVVCGWGYVMDGVRINRTETVGLCEDCTELFIFMDGWSRWPEIPTRADMGNSARADFTQGVGPRPVFFTLPIGHWRTS